MFYLHKDTKYMPDRLRLGAISLCLATTTLVGCGGGDGSPAGNAQLSTTSATASVVEARPAVATNTVIASNNLATKKLKAAQCARLAKAQPAAVNSTKADNTRTAVLKEACAAEIDTEQAG